MPASSSISATNRSPAGVGAPAIPHHAPFLIRVPPPAHSNLPSLRRVLPPSGKGTVKSLVPLTYGYDRHGSLRRLGHGGSAVGTLTPATTGRTRLDGIDCEN